MRTRSAVGEWLIETMRDLLTRLLLDRHLRTGVINRDQAVLIGAGDTPYVLTEDEEQLVTEILENMLDGTKEATQ